ncbi:Bacterial type II secretion system protein F domain protein [Stieleria maiorica]|uniref:Bacterial type II secretion system protein F domain protein n=1 Tax=Stieleria maiorica TaxID=2795974 RepID=A0A5B9MDD7_9BACT|nr:type II secretion system F family protein [Stieleria maiorica]QEF99088.1 Bacterial type II secretion system protein F domain protein [Stieleria maiorica]
MNPVLGLITSIIVVAFLAIAVRVITRQMVRRPAVEVRSFLIAFLELFEWLLWAVCLVCLVVTAPHPVTLVLLALLVVSVVIAHRLRYREELQSLNRWLRMAVEKDVSLPELLENIAMGCRSRLARRIKACVKRLYRGESIVDAARRAKLALDADALGAMIIPPPKTALQGEAALPGEEIGSGQALDSTAASEIGHESPRAMALVGQQFTYVVATIILAWLIGIYIRSHLISLFDEIYDGMFSSSRVVHRGLDMVAGVGDVVAVTVLVWLLLVVVLRWLPLWLAPWVPWFGGKAVDQWRCEVLRTLGRGMRVGLAETAVLQAAATSTRIRWIRSRCRSAQRLVDAGTPLATALRSATLVTKREQVWLTCAAKNSNLPHAIEHLCRDIGRRQTHRWRIRMAWFVPLATVLVGIFVLVHTLFLFHFLYGLIGGLA